MAFDQGGAMTPPAGRPDAEIDLTVLRVGAMLNRSSGSCDAKSEEMLRAILHDARVEPAEIRCVEGSQIDAALAGLAGADLDVLIVLGGDGTIRAAAEACGARGILLIALPGGTMNMLPGALYGERHWQEALTATLAAPRVLAVSGGEVAGHRFFCAAIFGAPSLWADAREAVRASRLLEAARRSLGALRRTFAQKVRYTFGDGARGTSAAVTVICPLVSAALRADEPSLEAAALDPKGARDAFSLAWNAVFANWRADPSVSTCATKTVEIMSRGRIPAILDGETLRLERRAVVRFAPDCFKALVPADSVATRPE